MNLYSVPSLFMLLMNSKHVMIISCFLALRLMAAPDSSKIKKVLGLKRLRAEENKIKEELLQRSTIADVSNWILNLEVSINEFRTNVINPLKRENERYAVKYHLYEKQLEECEAEKRALRSKINETLDENEKLDLKNKKENIIFY